MKPLRLVDKVGDGLAFEHGSGDAADYVIMKACKVSFCLDRRGCIMTRELAQATYDWLGEWLAEYKLIHGDPNAKKPEGMVIGKKNGGL